SCTGAANPDDFLSRGIGACVRLGCAPDVDWSLDACPVDHVARAVVRHAAATQGPSGLDLASSVRSGAVLHLRHSRPRHWRELVLWMRLRGYGVRLVPYEEWLSRLERTAERTEKAVSSPEVADCPLQPLLAFFRTRLGGVTLAESYAGGRRCGVCDERT